MLLGFLDTLGGFFDRRFIIAYWMPCFIFAALVLAEAGILYNYEATLKWWDALSTTTGALLAVALLFCVTVFAYLLQSFSVSLVRHYLGYWPGERDSFLSRWGRARERKVWKRHEISDERLLPTRLGNILASSYEYPHKVYYIDPAVWLPRLTPLLPQEFRTQMDNSLMPLFSLLNLCSLLLLFAFGGGLAVAFLDCGWPLFLSVWWGGLFLAAVCYRAAVSQVGDYGTNIRVAFDLYRHELLKQMRIPLPETPQLERIVWGRLTMWTHNKDGLPTYPWEPAMPPEMSEPQAKPIVPPDVELKYDNFKEPTSGAEEYTLTLPGSPPLILTLKKGT
jgi:hypothetical protein